MKRRASVLSAPNSMTVITSDKQKTSTTTTTTTAVGTNTNISCTTTTAPESNKNNNKSRSILNFVRTSFYDKLSSSDTISPVRLSYNSQRTLSSSTTPPTTTTTTATISSGSAIEDDEVVVEHDTDRLNYLLLIALYTLQGIPMGLSASIPFLIQQKIRLLATSTASSITAQNLATSVMTNVSTSATAAVSAAVSSSSAARDTYNANAIFALCSWPFSLKLLWAPIVDACYLKRRYGRRKSWIVPVQSVAGLLMIFGANFVERQLGLSHNKNGHGHTLVDESINVKGVTVFFFVLYFLMATQDVAVDGWALTMLSKKNRGRGPICNSIGQNIGYFLSFVGFLALNDAESCELIWRPLLGLQSNPEQGLVSLGSFIRSMGYFMLFITTIVAIFKRERVTKTSTLKENNNGRSFFNTKKDNDETDDNNDRELDAAEIGLGETYHRLWAVCKLPAVQWLFLILLTYRLPTSLSDNVKFLKAVEYGLSKSTTALLSPTIILPLGIIVPIVASRIWHNTPLQQFMNAYKLRVTIVPILDILMLLALRNGKSKNSISGLIYYWSFIILSTALQAIVSSMQFNAQMTFFAKRVDPAIGGSYMTLLNTAANLGGTWPASFVMWLMGMLSNNNNNNNNNNDSVVCRTDIDTGIETCQVTADGHDPFFTLQVIFSILGIVWILIFNKRVQLIEHLPDEAWRTHVILDKTTTTTTTMKRTKQRKLKSSDEESLLSSVDVDLISPPKYSTTNNNNNSSQHRWR